MAAAALSNREFDFLCAVARPRPDPEAIAGQLQAGLDFEKLLPLAAAHSVRPLFIRHLGRLNWLSVPPSARAKLEAFQHRHLPKSLAFAGELRRVVERFAREGIPFATFKGAALAAFLHGDLAAREFDDIDLIVPLGHIEAAERALADLGFHSAVADRRFRTAFLAHQRQFGLVHPDTGLSIDLHWEFSGDYVPFPISADDAFGDPMTVSVAGCEVPTLSLANLALLLAAHGTKEQWRCLELVVDFAWLVERHPDLDWRALHERASARHCGRAVLLGAALAERLLGVSAGLDVESVSVRANELIEQMQRSDLPPQSNFVDLELCDRPADRWKAMARLALLPSAGDYKAWPLPPALWWTYYVTRPFRLVAKTLG